MEKNANTACTWKNVEGEITSDDFKTTLSSSQESRNSDIEIIAVCENASKEFQLSGENLLPVSNGKFVLDELFKEDLPEEVYWHSILSALQSCSTCQQFVSLVHDLKQHLPDLPSRVHVRYNAGSDDIDLVAQREIPIDGPTLLRAIRTLGDSNCLCRATCKAFFNTDARHIEMRVRIIIEGIVNMKSYLSDDCLEHGASYIHKNADLPTVFCTFSEFYTPGQKLTEESIRSIYLMEMYFLARLGSYMGLWQLAQTATVPVHTVYPHRGESTIHNDFHRIFFPVIYPDNADDEEIVIMWTGLMRGAVPIHFVPLLKNPE